MKAGTVFGRGVFSAGQSDVFLLWVQKKKKELCNKNERRLRVSAEHASSLVQA